MKRASYRDAIDWLAWNYDTSWLGEEGAETPVLSVPAALICDIFEVSAERVVADLRRSATRAQASYVAP